MPIIRYDAQRATTGLSAADLGLEFVSVRRLEFSQACSRQVQTDRTEACLVVLRGSVAYTCVLKGGARQTGVADTMDILLLPPQSEAAVEAADSIVMHYQAPSELGADFQHVRFAAVDSDPATHHVYGKRESGSERHVWNLIDTWQRCSRLMLGICEGKAGGWTAWPPHEHSAEREEVYVYFDMQNSFGIQCVYEDLFEPGATAIVRDGNVVSIPRVYRPNTGCPAGRIKYVYCMAAKTPGFRDFMDLRIQPAPSCNKHLIRRDPCPSFSRPDKLLT